MQHRERTGGCLCGAVTYRVNGPMRPVVGCHCSQCRRTSGHHVAATAAARADVTVRGVVTWFVSSPQARRGFCGICGSNLFWDATGTHLSIFAGTLDAPTGLKLVGHIHCEDRGDYYNLADGLPAVAGADTGMTEPGDTWR